MGATYRLPDKMRPKLSRPLGKMYPAREIGVPGFVRTLASHAVVVSVGDRVTETIWRLGRTPDVQIVDGLENRAKRTPPKVPYSRTIRVRNPPGTITDEAMQGIRKAFEEASPVRVLVEGEEDLLAIPAVIFAPVSSAVYYGQPGEGVVMVSVDAASKARNRALLSSMKRSEET